MILILIWYIHSLIVRTCSEQVVDLCDEQGELGHELNKPFWDEHDSVVLANLGPPANHIHHLRITQLRLIHKINFTMMKIIIVVWMITSITKSKIKRAGMTVTWSVICASVYLFACTSSPIRHTFGLVWSAHSRAMCEADLRSNSNHPE